MKICKSQRAEQDYGLFKPSVFSFSPSFASLLSLFSNKMNPYLPHARELFYCSRMSLRSHCSQQWLIKVSSVLIICSPPPKKNLWGVKYPTSFYQYALHITHIFTKPLVSTRYILYAFHCSQYWGVTEKTDKVTALTKLIFCGGVGWQTTITYICKYMWSLLCKQQNYVVRRGVLSVGTKDVVNRESIF